MRSSHICKFGWGIILALKGLLREGGLELEEHSELLDSALLQRAFFFFFSFRKIDVQFIPSIGVVSPHTEHTSR